MVSPNSDVNGSADKLNSLLKILSSHKNGLKICHINAQSLLNKIDEFRSNFENSNVDIICISETWFSTSTSENLIKLNGYKLFRSDRETHAGGVAIYVKLGIQCKLILSSPADFNLEFIFLEVRNRSENILVGCVYRRNCRVDVLPLMHILEEQSVAYNNIVLAGDFNSNVLAENNLVEHMRAIGLAVVNQTTPTHFSSTVNTLLDLFFVSDSNKILLYDQLSANQYSKHDLIFLTYDFQLASLTSEVTFRDFKNINLPALRTQSSQIAWQSIYSMESVDEQVKFLEENIANLFEMFVPLKVRKCTNNPIDWLPSEVKILMRSRNHAYKRWKRYKTSECYLSYKNLRKRAAAAIAVAKTKHFENKFSTAISSKQKWSVIKNMGIVGKTQNSLDPVDLNLNEVNFAFVNFDTLNSSDNTSQTSIASSLPTNSSQNSFYFHGVSEADVLAAINSIKSQAVGLDNLHPGFLKLLLPTLLPYITHIFNNILTKSVFPSNWKKAKVLPLPKTSGDLRPISILPFLSKALEKLMSKQITI